MEINVDYREAIFDINEILNNMPKELEEQEKVILKKIGNLVKGNVVKFLHHSDVDARAKQIMPSNYDGSKPYIHMKDDVKYKIKKDKLGNYYVSIGGGKKTGYKWVFIDNGHIARDGTTFIPGTNFTTRAINNSEGEIEKSIDEMIKGVVG